MKKIMSLMIIVMLASLNALPSNEVVVNENLFVPNQDTVCKVADPTGTALNVRSKPKTGKVVTKLKNGTTVYVVDYDEGEDSANPEASVWAKISVMQKGKRKILGWVTTKFLNCD